MSFSPVTVSLPIADRETSYRFYLALGLEALGEIADDGVPEPLQFVLNDGLRLMFVPRGGFGWVVGGRDVASGAHECVVALDLGTHEEVDALLATAAGAGAGIVTEPDRQPWGYAGAFADPDGHIWMVRAD